MDAEADRASEQKAIEAAALLRSADGSEVRSYIYLHVAGSCLFATARSLSARCGQLERDDPRLIPRCGALWLQAKGKIVPLSGFAQRPSRASMATK